jgi:enoyl ACP reductase
MPLLSGKKLLITGVLTPDSIAFCVARVAQEEGADVVLTGFGRGLALTKRTAQRLSQPVDVLEMDVTVPGQLIEIADTLRSGWGRLDGVLHAVAYAPEDALGGRFLSTPWESAATALHVSAFSLKELTARMRPLMDERGGSVVALDFDASVAWPAYDWMGVSKAALESVTRYLARDLGRHRIRINCIAAGPIRTMAAKGIPGFDTFTETWPERAPLGWDSADPSPVAHAAAFLFSDHSRGITGEVLHVDGGFHAVGAS